MTGTPRILAISSGGGHWVQLLRLRPAFAGAKRVTFVTVNPAYRSDIATERSDADAKPSVPCESRFYVVNDATRWNKLGLVRMGVKLLWIILRERPRVIISTGAAPGYFAFRFGRLIGARTIWIDSVANVEQLSMTGQLVRPYTDLWLTQWPHLAGSDGPRYEGAVL